MSTTIKTGYLPFNSLYYVESKDEYFFEFEGRQNWLACNNNHGISIVYDQAFRQMYFNYDCNVIYSHYFYNDEDVWIKANKGYKLVGFFR